MRSVIFRGWKVCTSFNEFIAGTYAALLYHWIDQKIDYEHIIGFQKIFVHRRFFLVKKKVLAYSSDFCFTENICNNRSYNVRGLSSVGRASDLHSEGQEFDSPSLQICGYSSVG